MNWNEILDKMRCKHVAARRKNWSGDKYIFYIPQKCQRSVNFSSYGMKSKDVNKSVFVEVVSHILIHTKNNKLGFYTNTQCDMLADDWEVSE